MPWEQPRQKTYLYLLDYAKVFSIGTAKAKNLDAMRLFAGYTHSILDGEMDIHRAYMTRLGIAKEEAEQTPVALDNLSYTSYMLRVAYEEGGHGGDPFLRVEL